MDLNNNQDVQVSASPDNQSINQSVDSSQMNSSNNLKLEKSNSSNTAASRGNLVLMLVAVSMFLLLLVTGTVYVLKNNKVNNNTPSQNTDNFSALVFEENNEVENIVEDVPVSNSNSGVEIEEKFKWKSSYIFPDAINSQFSYYDSYYAEGSCIPTDANDFPISLKSHYRSSTLNQAQIANYIIENPSNSIGNDISFDETASNLVNSLESEDRYYYEFPISGLKGGSCGGSPNSPAVVFDYNYEGTDTSKLVVLFGSRHFVANTESAPIHFAVVSKIDN
ncbi:MAG: hypothetical protein Q9M91_01415 [Candidatus Dojkabacteria bacterium]|nr:hypothetical protein [Candidatus Dojkabacteria bacterium]MDQ7020483.1 hypothetical protein [Candidatus Dojkabacteria bacterium]